MEQALIDQVVARVVQKVREAETGDYPQSCAPADDVKPGLLILTQEHGGHCHQMLESAALSERYAIKCAKAADYQCSLEGVETVILYQLTIEALAKLSSGICDTPYTDLASKALLLGKRIYVPKEEVELYDYASTAPAVYYAMLEEKLQILMASGVIICPKAELENVILQKESITKPNQPCRDVKLDQNSAASSEAEHILAKRAITEKDLFAMKKEHITCVRIGEKAILTDLAKEFVSRNGMTVLRG